MRSTFVCSALCLVALLSSGCCVTVSRSGDCGADRCSTGFQNRIFGGGLFRRAAQNCGCDGGSVSGCGTNGGVSNGCGTNGGILNGCGANGGGILNGCGANGNVSDGCGCNGGVSSGCGCNTGSSNGCGCGAGLSECGCGSGIAGGGIGGGLNLPALGGGMGGGALGGGMGGNMGDGAFGGGMGDGGVALAGYGGGCGRFGCGSNGRYCLGCRLKNLSSGGHGGSGHGLLHKLVPNGMAGNHPYGGQLPHTEPIPTSGGPESTAPTYQYPYYTLRGPRDFLQSNPPSIGY